jgi:hypothetical protein
VVGMADLRADVTLSTDKYEARAGALIQKQYTLLKIIDCIRE